MCGVSVRYFKQLTAEGSFVLLNDTRRDLLMIEIRELIDCEGLNYRAPF